MTALMLLEVVLRGAFNSTTEHSDELVGYLLVGVSFLSLALCQSRGAFHRVEMVQMRLGPRGKAVSALVFDILSFAYIALTDWYFLQFVHELLPARGGGADRARHAALDPRDRDGRRRHAAADRARPRHRARRAGARRMSAALEVAIVLVVFLGLLAAGMAIPFAIGVPAIVYLLLHGGVASLKGIGLMSWGSMNSFALTAIPLFILMAEIMQHSGLSFRIYRGLSKLVCVIPGGLLQTNIAGCALFAAISGSSVATAAAIGTVALPQLIQRGYHRPLAAGSLAAGGTLGILIPPSIAMIVYGTFTETSVSKLFIAGIVPGLLLTACSWPMSSSMR